MCVLVCLWAYIYIYIHTLEKTVFLLNNSAVKMTISYTHVNS